VSKREQLKRLIDRYWQVQGGFASSPLWKSDVAWFLEREFPYHLSTFLELQNEWAHHPWETPRFLQELLSTLPEHEDEKEEPAAGGEEPVERISEEPQSEEGPAALVGVAPQQKRKESKPSEPKQRRHVSPSSASMWTRECIWRLLTSVRDCGEEWESVQEEWKTRQKGGKYHPPNGFRKLMYDWGITFEKLPVLRKRFKEHQAAGRIPDDWSTLKQEDIRKFYEK